MLSSAAYPSRMSRALLLAALLGVAEPVVEPASQPGEDPQETLVQAVRAEVSETDTGADHVVVTAEQLAATGERSLPRQLARAAGVWLQESNLGGGSPFLQGLSGNQVLLLVDGVRLNDSTTRNGVNQMLNGIEPAAVERVEVIRGPRSVLYGSDALGGVVLVWTKARTPRRAIEPGAHGGALEGHADSASEGWTGALELSGATPHAGVLAVLGAHDWGSLHTAEGEVDPTGYDGQSLFGSVTTDLGPQRSLRISTMVTRDHDVPRTDRLVPGFGQTRPSDEEFTYTLQDRRRVLLTYTDQGERRLLDGLEARLAYRTYDEERRIRSTGSSDLREERDSTRSVELGVDLRKALGESHLLTFGFDLDYDDVDSTRFTTDQGTGTTTPGNGSFAPASRFLSSGVFVQDEIQAFTLLDVTVGVRWNHFAFGFEDGTTATDARGTFTALGGSLSIGRPLTEDTRVVATVARGFRAPNLAELARDATFFGGDELHNPDLEPESSLYSELALERTRPAWNGALALFANTISDVVGSRLIDAGGPDAGDETYLRENIGTLRILGAFARTWTRLGGVASPWSLGTVAEFTYGQQFSDFVDPSTGAKTFDDVPGQRIPPLHGWLGLRREFDLHRLGWIEFGTTWALAQERLAPQDLADPRIDPEGTQGWATFDLDLGGPLGARGAGAHWFLGLHNLLDQAYRVHGSGLDGPGFGVVLGARFGPGS